MDARCADRPLALVGGRLSLLGEAVVRDLVDRGYDVHLSDEAGSVDLPEHGLRRVVTVASGDADALLASVVATRRPLALVVVEDAGRLAAEAAPIVSARTGGRLLALDEAGGHTGDPRTTVLAEARWVGLLPGRLARARRLRPHDRVDDADLVARRAVDAALAGRPRASYALRRPSSSG
jgi:hypothetical protein